MAAPDGKPVALFALAFFLALCHGVTSSKLSNLKMCADNECQTTISEGRAVKVYQNNDPRFLSFNKNDVIFIKSKGAGRVPYLWSGEVNGRFGFFPMSHVKEIQVFIKHPTSLVPTGEDVKEPEKEIKTSPPPPTTPPPEMKEADETEIEEDEPKKTAEEKKEPEAETDETEIDEDDEEEEEAPPETSETPKPFTTKEESITNQADQIMNVYSQMNEEIQKSKKKDDPIPNEPMQAEPQVEPSSQVSESTSAEIPYLSSSDIKRDPMETSHSDTLEQAHQTHSPDSSHLTRLPDDSVSRLIDATPAATVFSSQSPYTVFDGTTIFDGVTPESEAHQTATTSRFTYEKSSENVNREFVESSFTNQASSTETATQMSINIESSKQTSVNIDPSASSFVAPTSVVSSSFSTDSQHTFVKETLAMHPGIDDIPNRERQRKDVSRTENEEKLTGKTVFQPDKPDKPLHSVGNADMEQPDKPSEPQIGNFMKVFEIYMKYILDMSPNILQNFLEQKPLGIPPTILLSYIIVGIFASLIFVIICICFSGPTQKPRTDPIIIIRNLEEKLFITTKEKENLEDEIQAMKKNVCTLQQNMELQKTSTGSTESDLQRQKLLNEDLKEINESLVQQLNNFKKQCEDFACMDKKKEKLLKSLEQEKTEVSNEYKTICDKHHQLTLELTEKEKENSSLNSRLETLVNNVQHLETRKEQLLEEEEQWAEKYRELTENWEQSQAQYVQMRETLDFKENELEQMKECFLQLKAFEESEEAEVSEEFQGSTSMQDKIQSMLDVSRVKAMLTAAEEENAALHKSRQIEIECRLELEDQIETMKRDVETFQADKAKAIRQNEEAQTKLNVLTTYFKEKEMQFQRELGEHEILKKQNINKLGTAEEKAKSIESELQSYRSQIEDLKQEINKAERDFRAQIASNEKKAHDNWLATRAAERELKESRVECTLLRQKLTELERRPMHGSLIRPLPTRGSGHLEMGNGPPLLPPFPPGEHPAGRKDLMPPGRDDQSKPPMKSPSPNFQPPLRPSPPNFRPPRRPSPPNFRPPPPMKKRGPPPPPNMSDAFPPWQMLPPGPRPPFGNRPPPPPPSKMNPPRGPPYGSHPPPPMMPPRSQHRSPSDFSPLPEKHPISKQHSQV